VRKTKTGLSLVEILIAMLILAIAAAGLFSSFVAANRFVSRSKRRMAAINFSRQISEELYKKVQADTWNISANNLLACPDKEPNGIINNNDYPCAKYNVPNLLPNPLPADNPLYGFNPEVDLNIDLDGDIVANPDCYINCPRIVNVTIEWNE
jgi:prepilin-type N-terminal cleavage/methylation domain-containing protein